MNIVTTDRTGYRISTAEKVETIMNCRGPLKLGEEKSGTYGSVRHVSTRGTRPVYEVRADGVAVLVMAEFTGWSAIYGGMLAIDDMLIEAVRLALTEGIAS